MRKAGLFTSFILGTLTLVVCLTSCASGGGSGNKTDKTAAELLDIVLDSVDFPQTVEVTEEERLTDMGIDLTLTEDCAVVQQMLSVDVVEVIILKAKDGETDKLVERLEERKDALINEFAFYPEQVESANATVVSSEKDVVYLICHADAQTAEQQLISAINS